jgi:hypothetical protein
MDYDPPLADDDAGLSSQRTVLEFPTFQGRYDENFLVKGAQNVSSLVLVIHQTRVACWLGSRAFG